MRSTAGGCCAAGLAPTARHEPDPSAWRGHFDAYVAAFEPTLGPQEGPPEGYKGDLAEDA